MAVNNENPVVVLVHGAFHGAWCWLTVLDRLVARGVTTTTVNLPLTSFQDDVTALRHVIASFHSPVIVVAHSYAGLVVCEGAQEAAHLVFIAARMTAPVGARPELVEHWQTESFQHLTQTQPDGAISIHPSAGQLLYSTTPAAVAAVATNMLRPMRSEIPTDPLVSPAWRHVPSTYFVCARDEVVLPGAQRVMARHAGRTVELDCDHSPFFSMPSILVDHIIGAVRRAVE